MRPLRILVWLGVAVLGATGFGVVALARGEAISAAWLIVAAVCTFAVGYRFYSRVIARRVMQLDDSRPTPAVRLDDGRDFVPTNRWVVFGHHFAAIAGPGPLIGPVLASQFGYLPGTIWILVGVVLGGAVQDFVVLVASLRRDGRSLAKMARDYLGPLGAAAGAGGILAIMVILIAVLGLVVVNALAQSPWGLFTVGATVPIALVMGTIMRGGGARRVPVATAVGLALLACGLAAGRLVAQHPALGPAFTLKALPLAVLVIAYGLAASILPVWLLLAPRDYLSTFVKLGTVFLLALGILAVRPDLHMPPLTRFVDGSGPIFGGKVFPFCFITIACGAVSGFHSLIASGTTPKLLSRETEARMVGYGGMLLEAFVAVMAVIAAASLPPGQYFAVNSNKSLEWINQQGFPVTMHEMDALAARVGERSVLARTGGAPCLAVGMAGIFQRFLGGERLAGLWYHFAIMFEALFILTTLDAGTRVGRYLLHDVAHHVAHGRAPAPLAWIEGRVWFGAWPRRCAAALARTDWPGTVLTSLLFVALWGYFLIGGVLDPNGGVRALWPLFGIANQLLAATALAIVTTILFKTGRKRFAWVTITPLLFLLAVTMTAGVQYVFDRDPQVGFLARAAAIHSGAIVVDPAIRGVQVFNARLDAALAGLFLVLVGTVVLSAARQWVRVITGREAPAPDAPPGGAAGAGEPDPPGRSPVQFRCC